MRLGVVYRVLDPVTTDYSGESGIKTMLLDCDVSLMSLPYMKDDMTPSWEDSYVREYFNGEAFLYNDECFTEPEREAIIESVKEKPSADESDTLFSVTRNVWLGTVTIVSPLILGRLPYSANCSHSS